MTRRVWVRRTALAGGLVVIAIFGILQTNIPPSPILKVWLDARRQAFSHAWHSRQRRAFDTLLADRVVPGASMRQVKEVLGEGALLAGEDRRKYMVIVAKMGTAEFPDGVEESDVFLRYNGRGGGVTLTFRGDKLVNFNPQHYKKDFGRPTAVAIPIPQ